MLIQLETGKKISNYYKIESQYMLLISFEILRHPLMNTYMKGCA